MKVVLTTGFAFVAAGLLAAPAAAGTVGLTFRGIEGRSVSLNYDGSRATNFTNRGTIAGRFTFEVTTAGSHNGYDFNEGRTVYTFCTEITEYTSGLDQEVIYDFAAPEDMPSDGPTIGTFRAGLLQELFDAHYADVVSSFATDEQKAAFQLAVWEAVYEDGIDDAGDLAGLDVSDINSTFWATGASSSRSLANTWLGALLGNVLVSDRLIGFLNDGKQDQLVMVPLPAPVALAAVGLAGIVIGHRRLLRLV